MKTITKVGAGMVGALAVGIGIGRAWESSDTIPKADAHTATSKAVGEEPSRAKGALRPEEAESESLATSAKIVKAQRNREQPDEFVEAARQEVAGELEKLKHERAALKESLKELNEKTAELEEAAGLKRDRHQFDLDKEDWRKLGEAGALMVRLPCSGDEAANLSEATLDRLGLGPDDAPTIAEAFRNSRERQWATLGPACATALGGSLEKAKERGIQSCKHLVINHGQNEGKRTLESARRISAFRAGDTEVPKEGWSQLDAALLAMTQEAGLFEAELAEAFGPAEAHRIVFTQEGLCFTEATFGLDKPLRNDGPWGLEK
jgi:hypothetical protein